MHYGESEQKRQNVKNGSYIEDKIRNIFGLEKSSSHFSSKPDILDYNKGIVGEIKALKRGNRVVLYTDQIKRYLKLAEEINALTTINGPRMKMSAKYFIACYDHGNVGFLSDVYILTSDTLEILLDKDEKNTLWALKGEKGRIVAQLKDTRQRLLDGAQRDEIINEIIQSNYKGAYVRLGIKELDDLCPNVIDRYNNISLRVHS